MSDQKTSSNPIPPQNIEAEQSVLGSLMLDKDAIAKIADLLKPGDFYRNIHNDIYQAMAELYERNEPIDLLSLTSRLQDKKLLEKIGGSSYLTTLTNTIPTAAHIVHYAKLVKNKKILRDLISTSHKITALSYDEPDDIENLVNEAEQQIFAISQTSPEQKFVLVKDELKGAMERIDRIHQEGQATRGISTGFEGLDKYLSGFQKSDMVILAGRPSLGKTTLALDFVRHTAVKQSVPVAVFSLEMAKEQLIDRLLASQAGINLWQMRTGSLPEEHFVRINRAMDELSRAPIFIDDTSSPTVMQIRANARRIQAEHGLGMIVIDYIQLIQPRSSFDSSVQQFTEISRHIKGLARELKLPVIALSQLNRAVEHRSPAIPKLADLRETGCLLGNALITSAKTGRRFKIKTLAERKVQKPLEVLAVDSHYRLTPHKMLKVFHSGKKMVYELKTRSGRKIKASANHPFLKLNSWTALENLNAGDAIALPRKLSIQKAANPLAKDELILLAHLLGDGCVLPRQSPHYTNADMMNIETVRKAARRLFKIKGKIVKQKNWYHVYLSSPYRLTRGKYNPITLWFRKLRLQRVRSWKKRIPTKVFQCDDKHIALFLKHLWSTDGNLSWKRLAGRKPAGNIYYATSSPKLAEQIQHLLLRLDIQSSLRETPSNKGYRLMYHLQIEGSPNQLKFLQRVGIADKRRKLVPKMIKTLKAITPNPNRDVIPKEAWRNVIEPAKERVDMSWRTFSMGIETAYCGCSLFKRGIGRARMQRVYGVLPDRAILDLAESDIYWDEIVSVEKIGVKDVYDATVEGAHNFLANDIVVHNSLEQEADVVMMIYRRDKEKGKWDEDEETSSSRLKMADIIIAKHRNGPIGKVELCFNEEQVCFQSPSAEIYINQ